jgi:hypothetical protein
MKVKSYLSENVDQLYAILPADASPDSLPSDVNVSLGKLTFIREFELSSARPLMGIDTQVALRNIQFQGYHLAKIKLEFSVTEQNTTISEPTPGRNVKLPETRTLTMITGAGASISFGLPSTVEFTDLIAAHLRGHSGVSEHVLGLYDEIYDSLTGYLVNPGIVTFEDIYQSIQDVRTIQSVPSDRQAYDGFRPRVGATHVLNNQFSSYSDWDGFTLQNAYLDQILYTFLSSLSSVRRQELLSTALNYIRGKFLVWSFTLNYDNILGDLLHDCTSGFIPGSAPRAFRPATLFSALEERNPIHSHLHGSLKFGFPIGEPLDMFELHEYDSSEEGVQHSTGSRPSGRPVQSGETLPPSPIITGLSKTELIFRQPFFTNFLAFFRALNLCTDVLIAGYGFPDRHVNMGIQQFRMYRPDVRTYIVDRCEIDHPSSYMRIDRLNPDNWRVILSGDPRKSVKVASFPGWWKVPGISDAGFNTGPIFLWLNGFDTFCEAVVDNGFPE